MRSMFLDLEDVMITGLLSSTHIADSIAYLINITEGWDSSSQVLESRIKTLSSYRTLAFSHNTPLLSCEGLENSQLY